MAIQTYKVSLRPVGKFYFGNERTFGPRNEFYFVRSNFLPQQTTLLGLLRYRLLEMRGWLTDNSGHTNGTPEAREGLIGPKSFAHDDGSIPQPFGVIQELSPVLIQLGDDLLLPGALNRSYELTNSSNAGESWWSLAGGQKMQLPVLDQFDYKDPVEEHFISTANKKSLSYQEVFQKDEKVGITKKRDNQNDDDKFFKQVCWRFVDPRGAFTFFVRLEEKIGDELLTFVHGNPLVPMGGERLVFFNEISKEPPNVGLFALYSKFSDRNPQRDQVILLNDSLVPPDIYRICDFAVSQTGNFRHIKTTNQTSNFSEKPGKSKAFQLLERGSVLYPSPAPGIKALTDLLDNHAPGFRQIGYNSYATIMNGQVKPYLFKPTEKR